DMDVEPAVLTSTGFTFTHSTVEEAVAAAVPERSAAATGTT
ncbi:MAG: DUF1731 domain-containing protein, partial [Microbacterium sp.]|nr:DUF1731 domain-containing protein [Microbacterium sp.]